MLQWPMPRTCARPQRTTVRMTVLLRIAGRGLCTAMCRAASRDLIDFSMTLWGIFHSFCFSLYREHFREVPLRFHQRLFLHCFLDWICKIEYCSTLIQQLIQVCLSLLPLLIFVFRVLLVLSCPLSWMLGFVLSIWLWAKFLILGRD